MTRRRSRSAPPRSPTGARVSSTDWARAASPDASELPGEVGEVVRDFIEISHAAVDAESGEESNENAYTELVEFVRVGVQLLFEELASARRPGAPTATPLH